MKKKPAINRIITLLLFLGVGVFPLAPAYADLENFCERLPRPAYEAFQKHESSNGWFEVYEVGPGIWAIYEPFQWQEVISYLIIGTEIALPMTAPSRVC